MKRVLACVLGILLFTSLTARAAEGPATQEEVVALLVRSITRAESDPRAVAAALGEHGIRFAGFHQRTITLAFDGQEVHVTGDRSRTMGADLVPRGGAVEPAPASDPSVAAGEKTDLTLTMWLYEWRRYDGTYREQTMVSGHWSNTEYSWMDDPADVIDLRWIVGDIVYLSSTPFDGVQRDQHTQGIASFTVDDQVADWDLFVNFRPVSSDVYGRWTNVFVNYSHTWWGARLSVQLGAGPTGSTGNITINTDAQTWTEGTGLAFRIGSGESRGPVQTGVPGDPVETAGELR
ncbi:MAG: hypothetical protein ACOY93_09325 [Bacillota bacterium]